jgi:hypothetical protein
MRAMPVVADLRPGVDLAAGLAGGGAEVAMVEHDHPEAGCGEHLGVPVESQRGFKRRI